MPIFLDDLKAAPVTKTYSPKFFSSALTGTNGKVGVLGAMLNPGHIAADKNKRLPNGLTNETKRNLHNSGTSSYYIPFYTLSEDMVSYLKYLPMPEARLRQTIACDPANQNRVVDISCEMHVIHIQETPYRDSDGKSHINRLIHFAYQVDLVAYDKTQTPADGAIVKKDTIHAIANAAYRKADVIITRSYTANIAHELDYIIKTLEQGGWACNTPAATTWLNSLVNYDMICRRSEVWQETLDKEIAKNTEMCMKGLTGYVYDKHLLITLVSTMLANLENYTVPLNLYRSIYTELSQFFNKNDLDQICKCNLNLLLSNTMHELDQIKGQLSPVPCDTQPPREQKLSAEQKNAVMATEPLICVQAGAGSGKSYCILHRIDQMIDCGIEPKDITVLSFTNAAADHIKERNENINSMTIASMIHTIYSKNYDHQLSTCSTLMNSIDIYLQQHPLAQQFKRLLRAIDTNDNQSYTKLNTFVEENFDEVIHMLDVTGQVTLELEIIICYQRIDTMVEPTEVTSRHLIVDETQDNSIFEFVYILRYIIKHQESLFIVGDASQTLFEFRGSNPRALNVMEGSGVFATYKLQTNYRSNQDILDFANVALQGIEANQYANIQLQANSLDKVTSASFTDRVRLDYHRISRIAEVDRIMPQVFHNSMVPYIRERVAADEKVCFLAYQRKYVRNFAALVEEVLPDMKIVDITPERTFSSTVFSEYISRYWNEAQFMPTNNMTSMIQKTIMNHLDTLIHGKSNINGATNSIQNMLIEWSTENRGIILAWHRALVAGQLTHEKFLDQVQTNMLDFEITRNAVKQAVISRNNGQQKRDEEIANANIICSTIHSAKGLEFDNTIVLYRAESSMSEENKRLYYVALTRAKNTELIVAYDTHAKPAIQTDYNSIVETLKNNETAAQATSTATN